MNIAGRGRRLGAALIDAALLAACTVALSLDEVPVFVTAAAAAANAALFVAQAALLTRRGQTVGKLLLGVRIVRRDTGRNAGFATNVLVRSLANGLLCLVPGYFLLDSLFIFRADRLCLHDLLAGTVVVADAPAPDAVPS